jgi:hypothetical protein
MSIPFAEYVRRLVSKPVPVVDSEATGALAELCRGFDGQIELIDRDGNTLYTKDVSNEDISDGRLTVTFDTRNSVEEIFQLRIRCNGFVDSHDYSFVNRGQNVTFEQEIQNTSVTNE